MILTLLYYSEILFCINLCLTAFHFGILSANRLWSNLQCCDFLNFSVTSRPQREYEDNGKNYWFLDREEMEKQIKQHKFLEYGEHNGHLYGTSLDSIRNVINEGKMCVLDCSPSVSKIV